MHIKEYLKKIVEEGDKKEMEELSHMLDELVCHLKECDYKLYCKYKMKLYRMAYGDVLTKEMAEEIIMKMMPYHMKWTLEQAKSIQQEYNMSDIRDIDFWIVINSAYNDYCDLFGENVEMYVKFTKDFIKDEDAKEGKVFKYFTEIPKSE